MPRDRSQSRDPSRRPADRSRPRERQYRPRYRDDREHQAQTAYAGPWDHYGPRSTVPIPASYHLDQPARGHHWYARQHWWYAASETNWHSSNPQAQTAAWEHAYSSGRTAFGDRFPPMWYSSASDSSAAEEPPQD